MIASFPTGGFRRTTWSGPLNIPSSGLVSLFSCWHCVDITVKKLRAICDLSGAVAHLFLFGTPIGSWRFSIFWFSWEKTSRKSWIFWRSKSGGCCNMSCKPLLGLNDASIEWDKDVQYKCSMSKQSESELTMEFLELTWRASKIVGIPNIIYLPDLPTNITSRFETAKYHFF